MRKCPVCEENIEDEALHCKVCGEMVEPVVPVKQDFVLSSEIKSTVIPLWIIIAAISVNALIVGYWLGSMAMWGAIKWIVHLH